MNKNLRVENIHLRFTQMIRLEEEGAKKELQELIIREQYPRMT